jgi:hypothetical protein
LWLVVYHTALGDQFNNNRGEREFRQHYLYLENPLQPKATLN